MGLTTNTSFILEVNAETMHDRLIVDTELSMLHLRTCSTKLPREPPTTNSDMSHSRSRGEGQHNKHRTFVVLELHLIQHVVQQHFLASLRCPKRSSATDKAWNMGPTTASHLDSMNEESTDSRIRCCLSALKATSTRAVFIQCHSQTRKRAPCLEQQLRRPRTQHRRWDQL